MATKDQTVSGGARKQERPSSREAGSAGLLPLARSFIDKFNNDWTMNLAAALAYNLLLSVFPIVVALLAILGVVLGRIGGDALNYVIGVASNVLPAEVDAAHMVRVVQETLSHSSGVLGLIAVLSALFFGSRLFVLLESCFSIIYRFRPRPLLGQNLMAIGMLLVFTLLVPVLVFASSLPALAFSVMRFTEIGRNPLLTSVEGILGGIVASFLLFEFIYLVVPNERIRFSRSWPGALLAAVGLQLYVQFFPLYASHFLTGIAGAVGFTAILLVFFYYFAVILLFGAEVNAFFFEGVRPIPNDVSTFVSTMAGKLNEDIPEEESKAHVNTRPTDTADKEHTIEYVSETEEPDVPNRVAKAPHIRDAVFNLYGLRERLRQTHPSEANTTREESSTQHAESTDAEKMS